MKWLDLLKKFKKELPEGVYNVYIQFDKFTLDDIFSDLYVVRDEEFKSRIKSKDTVELDGKEAIKFNIDLSELSINNNLSLDLINLTNKYFEKVRIVFENSNGIQFDEEIIIRDVSMKNVFTLTKQKIRKKNEYKEKYILKMKKFTKSS